MNDPSQNSLPSLKILEKKILHAEKRAAEPEHTSPSLHGNDPTRATALAFRMAIDLGSGLAVGTVLGVWVDDFFNSAPLFLLIGMGVGCAAGLKLMIRTNEQAQEAMQLRRTREKEQAQLDEAIQETEQK